jgi:tRNA threonylcarbamoyladenosine biosynthesis protein TsaE
VRLNEDELKRFGEAFGRDLHDPVVIGFSGELGSGKTTLVQAICRGLGAERAATSPTYALVHRYEAPNRPIYHVDCYRLQAPDDARDLGFDDMVREGAIVLIEWPERAGPWVRLDRHWGLGYDPDPSFRTLDEL